MIPFSRHPLNIVVFASSFLVVSFIGISSSRNRWSRNSLRHLPSKIKIKGGTIFVFLPFLFDPPWKERKRSLLFAFASNSSDFSFSMRHPFASVPPPQWIRDDKVMPGIFFQTGSNSNGMKSTQQQSKKKHSSYQLLEASSPLLPFRIAAMAAIWT